jgi:hypothetical protein
MAIATGWVEGLREAVAMVAIPPSSQSNAALFLPKVITKDGLYQLQKQTTPYLTNELLYLTTPLPDQ